MIGEKPTQTTRPAPGAGDQSGARLRVVQHPSCSRNPPLLGGVAALGLSLGLMMTAPAMAQAQQQESAAPAQAQPQEPAQPQDDAPPSDEEQPGQEPGQEAEPGPEQFEEFPLQRDLLMPFDPDDPVQEDEMDTGEPLVEAEVDALFGDDADSFAGLNVLAGFGVRFAASTTFSWTDNFRRAAAGGDNASEFRILPAASVRLGHPLGQQALYFNANVGWQFHTRNPEFDSERLGVGGGLQWRLGQACGGSIDLSWSRQQAQFDFFDEARASIQSRTGAAFGATCNAPGRFITSFGATTGRFRYEGGNREFADSNSVGVNGSIGYPVGLAGVLGVSASWNEATYPRQISILTGDEVTVELVSVSGFVRYRLGPFLSVSGSLGWSEITSNSPFQPGFDGLSWSLSANYSSGRLGASLGFGRSVSGGDGRFANASVVDNFTAVVSYRAGPNLSLNAGYGRAKRDNLSNPQVPPEFIGADTTVDRLFASARTRLLRIFSASLAANYVTRASNRSQFDSDSTTISLTLGTGF